MHVEYKEKNKEKTGINIFGDAGIIFGAMWNKTPRWVRIVSLFSVLGSVVIVLLVMAALLKYILT